MLRFGYIALYQIDGSNTAVVNLSVQRGSPQHLASGFIYGIPDTPNQIPDHFYTDIGFRYTRAGGAQLDAGGWIYGPSGYQGRFASTKSNYDTTRKYGGDFIILPHDIWGTDHANASTVWPGDNGDWTDYDDFLDTLLADLKTNDMLEDMVFDIWNEPDLGGGAFWNRSQSQWIDTYVRTHKRIRQDPELDGMLITGPSTSSQPTTDNTWWTNWLSAIRGNDTIPDQYAWHLEADISSPNDDLQTNNVTLGELLQQYELPERQVNINEYAVFDEQVATGAAWWISRLERYDALGLRGHWLSACQLHDFMASLLSKPGASDGTSSCTGGDYYPNGEYQVYKYYNLNMTGSRVKTTGSGDRILDVYTTVDDKVRTLTGVRLQTGTWYITISNLSAVGLPSEGALDIQTWGFEDKGHYGEVDGPSDRGVVSHDYSGDSVTFPVYQTAADSKTAWAFEFSIGY
ncbi:glycoside hydrolase family 39 protein [Polychaeton citri CBS 116435]|uniref:Glycoside hydrolase family 39 protein n=1 Tax=Polychaeton citri CBS 116435 TaxID=1314669 RepID=A0A9P4Q641_9PEZI|nr:glycoside hydrolase family 39 protein [Polychaeton citri CBS 116435]